jgi:homoserine kinase type II
LHEVWADETHCGVCPGVRNRLRILAENESLLREGLDALPLVAPPFGALFHRVMPHLTRLAPFAVKALQVWERHKFVLQPCLRDLRAEHVLFEDGHVSAIIDYGATSIESPAADLARMLGDWSSANELLFGVGLSAYRAIRPHFDAPDDFVRLLSRTGIVCSVLGWIVRLAVRREGPVNSLAAVRLGELVSRIEQFTHF